LRIWLLSRPWKKLTSRRALPRKRKPDADAETDATAGTAGEASAMITELLRRAARTDIRRIVREPAAKTAAGIPTAEETVTAPKMQSAARAKPKAAEASAAAGATAKDPAKTNVRTGLFTEETIKMIMPKAAHSKPERDP